MLKDDCCYHILKLHVIPLHWKLKKSEQAEIVAFNRFVVNYNTAGVFYIRNWGCHLHYV